MFSQTCETLSQSEGDIVAVRGATFMKVRGDFVDVFQCTPRRGAIVESSECMVDIELAEGQGYVDPWTKILKDRSSPRPCRDRFPNVVRM